MIPPGFGTSVISHMALAPNGDLIVAGSFHGLFDLDPSAGTDSHGSMPGFSDAFVSRLGPDGVPRWTKVLAGSEEDGIFGLAVDDEGAVALIGTFSGRLDLDPGPGEDIWTTTPTAQGSNTTLGYVMELSPTGDRRWIWSPGPESACMAVTSARGTVLIGGYFTGPTDFDPGPATDMRSSLRGDAFVIALDHDGQLTRPAWTFGGANSDTVHTLAIGPDGSWYLAGVFSDGADLDPGSGVVTLPIDDTQYTAAGYALALGAGGALGWVKPFPPWAGAPGLAVDKEGHAILWGSSRGGPPDPFGFDQAQTFVTRLDRAGDVDWTRTWVPPIGIIRAVAAADGSLALAGNFREDLVVEGHTFFQNGANFSTLLVGLSPLGETRSIQAFGDSPPGSLVRFVMTTDLLALPDGKLLLAGSVGGEVPLGPAGVATVPVGVIGFVAQLPAP